MNLCKCGCEAFVQKTYKTGHNPKNLNKKFSEDHKRKIALGNKGKIVSEETKRKLSLANKGKKNSEETIQRMKLAHTGIKFSEERKMKISKGNKGIKKPYLIERNKKMIWTQEMREKIRLAALKRIFPKKDTKIEVAIQNELSTRGYAYYCHYPIKGQPDIAFPEQKIAIFADGCYWHNCKECGFENKREKQDMRDKFVLETLQSEGWLVLRYREHEINGNTAGVADEIEEAVMLATYGNEELMGWLNK